MDSLQSVLAYVVVHPWKTLLFLVLGVYAIGETWHQIAVLLILAAFVAVFDT